MRFHKSLLGKFATDIVTDSEGYCYTTVIEWMTECGMDEDDARSAVVEVDHRMILLNTWQLND